MPIKGERKHINSKEVNKKNKDGGEYSKNIITKNYETREHKDYEQQLYLLLII
jgi:hypothetical protein